MSLTGIVTIALLLLLAGFYVFDPDFRNWLGLAYEAFSSGKLETIREFLAEYKEWGYLILLGAFLLQMFVFVLPSVTIMIVSVLMYGPIEGALISIGGIFIASTVAYFLGKALSTALLDKLIGRKSREKMSAFLENYGFWTVTVFRISPFFSNDAISFVAGLVRMNYWRFISATLVGITPLSILIAYYGRSVQRMETGLIIASAIGLLGLVFYIYVDKRKLNR